MLSSIKHQRTRVLQIFQSFILFKWSYAIKMALQDELGSLAPMNKWHCNNAIVTE